MRLTGKHLRACVTEALRAGKLDRDGAMLALTKPAPPGELYFGLRLRWMTDNEFLFAVLRLEVMRSGLCVNLLLTAESEGHAHAVKDRAVDDAGRRLEVELDRALRVAMYVAELEEG